MSGVLLSKGTPDYTKDGAMVKFGGDSVFRKVSVPFNVIIIICSLLFLVSCQTMQPAGSQEISNLANELEEANQKLEEIYHRVSVVQFMVDNHERTITDLEKIIKKSGVSDLNTSATGIKTDTIPSVVTEDPVEKKLLSPESKPDTESLTTEESVQYRSPEFIYNQGFSALKTKNYAKAVSMFKTIVSKYPAHNLADNAIYWTGEIHYTQNDFPEAIRTFKRLVDKYPEGGKVADALLKVGYSYYSMKDTENAVKYLKMVVLDYPFSVSGSKAEAMLNKIE